MRVYHVAGAAPGSTVAAQLLSADTGNTAAEVLATVYCQANSAGTWEFQGPWPPLPGGNAHLLSQAQAQATFGLASTVWQITEPQVGGADPVVWNVTVSGATDSAASVSTLPTASVPSTIKGVPGSGGAGNGANGVPNGGTTGQVLAKNSSTNGDATWVTPAAPGNETPLANSGSGTPGTGLDYSRDDHVHPAGSSAGAGGVDAYLINVASLTTGTRSWGGAYAAGNYGSNSRGSAYPFRVSQSGTFHLGVNVTAAGASPSYTRLAVFADDRGGTGGPGTLLFDSGQIDSSTTGQKTSTGTVALSAGTRYWIVASGEGTNAPSWSQAVVYIPVAENAVGTASGHVYRLGQGPYANSPTIVAVDTNGIFSFFLSAA